MTRESDPAPLYPSAPAEAPSGAAAIVALLTGIAQQRARRRRTGRR